MAAHQRIPEGRPILSAPGLLLPSRSPLTGVCNHNTLGVNLIARCGGAEESQPRSLHGHSLVATVLLTREVCMNTIAKRLKPLLAALFLMSLVTGYTDCGSFTTVVVPNANTANPDVYSSFYNLNTAQYTQTAWNGTYNSRKVGYEEGYLVVVSVVDPDGATELITRWNTRVRCCTGTGTAKRCDPGLKVYSLAHGEQWQEALPGQSVSNGIYDYPNFLPKTSLEAACGSRARTSEFVLDWQVSGLGFGSPWRVHRGQVYYNAVPPV